MKKYSVEYDPHVMKKLQSLMRPFVTESKRGLIKT